MNYQTLKIFVFHINELTLFGEILARRKFGEIGDLGLKSPN